MRKHAIPLLPALLLAAACGDLPTTVDPAQPHVSGPVFAVGTDLVTGATIETNMDDYAPGQDLNVTGHGWAADETVHLYMSEDPDVHADIEQDVQADADGNFALVFYTVQEEDLGVTFTLTAIGATSGSRAVATFTDAQPFDVAMQIFGSSDGTTPHPTVADEEDLGSVTGGSTLALTCPRGSGLILKGTGPYAENTVDWTLAVGGAGADNSTLSSLVTLPVASGQFTSASDQPCEAMSIATTGLTAGTTYHGSLQLTGTAGALNATTGYYFFKFTVSGSTAISTTTALASNNNPSDFGQSVTFTATVTPASGPAATGTVNFYEFTSGQTCDALGGAVALGSDGSAPFQYATSNLSVGSHTITACYVPDTGWTASSGSVVQVVNPVTTSTAASVTTTSPQYSDDATLRAVVTPHTVLGSELTGTVRFYFGSAAATCPATLPASGYDATDDITAADDGVAEVNYQITGASGDYVLTACFYSTNSNFGDSHGSSGTVAVGKEDAVFTNVDFAGSIDVAQTTFTVGLGVKELLVGGNEPDQNAGQHPGDISLVTGITAKITGIATNTSYNGSCGTGSGGSASYGSTRSFTCTFSGGPFVVDAYTLTLDIPTSNTYWQAATYEDAMSVYDPAAGFATGGGAFVLDGDRVTFGFSYTAGKGKSGTRSGFVTIRHMADGGTCRVKSTNQMNAPAVNGNTVTLSGKGNYSCVDASGVPIAGQSQGNITIAAYAEDNATPGAGMDRFWVTNAAGVSPNYLQMPASASANAALLTGGNVQVPQPSKGKK